jgi:hypothetical protein
MQGNFSTTLMRPIAAIPLTEDAEGVSSRGAVRQLPPGAKLFVVGSGFTEATVKVIWDQRFYFVFAEDLSGQYMSAYA